MRHVIIAALAVIALAGCTKREKSVKVLESSGYTDITITGYNWFGCGKDDSFHTGFKAKGPNGKDVEGVVCSGWFKGSTVRID